MKSYFLLALLYCTVISIIIIIYTSFRDFINPKAIISTVNLNENLKKTKEKVKHLKYILQWTLPNNVPFVYMGKGLNGFIDRQCPYINCYVTSDKFLLGDYTKFDVIAFAGPELSDVAVKQIALPERRSVHQKYVFASIESSGYYPLCNNEFNGFFNWTWTYKLDSEVRWGYIVIRDNRNNIIGPKKDMNWLKLEHMFPVPEMLNEKLKNKKKAAAWFVSNCETESGREHFYRGLQVELAKYKLSVDVYGTCGSHDCPRGNETYCDAKIADEYYFYLSFENSFSEDYVTEKLLRALKNDAVPIVYGDANYTRFMPDGIYLNARQLGVKKLAAKMYALMNDPEEYAEYFKWKSHYSYHKTSESVETDEYCRFCEILNDAEAMNRTTVYQNFKHWWNPPNRCQNDSSSALTISDLSESKTD